MNRPYIEDQTFDNIDYKTDPLPKGDYEECIFTSCDFSSTDLSSITFINCEFRNCNLSSAKVTKTAFQTAKMTDCKIMGVLFDSCSDFLFAIHFEKCNLSFSSFQNFKLRDSSFANCNLSSVDFSNADVSSIKFDNCDFMNAVFDGTNAEKADLRTSLNYSIDPTKNRLRKAKFSLAGVAGLLDNFDIIID